jgi:dipeptidyl aminopeptidase/acylaminoacyl peptidase
VAGIDGSARTTLDGEYRDIDAVDWSPDGSAIAFVSNVSDLDSITVATTDGSTAKTLPLGRNVWQIQYLPDGRLAIMAAEQPGEACPVEDPTFSQCALFLVNADGTGLELLRSSADFHGLGLDPSPDGTALVYVEWNQPDAPGRLHVVDLLSRADRPLPLEGFPTEFNHNRAWFSPDGSRILFDFFEAEGDHWATVPTSGGPVVRIGPEWPGDAPDAFWAPDGRTVLSRYPTGDIESQLWVLDVTGDGSDTRLDVDVPYLPAWQRVGV